MPAWRGEALDRLGEGEVVDLHHEVDGVAALLAAEAVEEPLARADLEGGGLLVVEGAQALEVAAARVAQLEVLGDDGVDRDRVPNRLHVLVVDPSGHAVNSTGAVRHRP